MVFVAAAGSVVIGAGIYSMLRPRSIFRSESGPTGVVSSHRVRTVAGVLAVIPLALQVVGYGTRLLYRPEYLLASDTGNPVIIASQTLALPAAAVLGWLTQVSLSRAGKLVSLVVLTLYAVILFSLATRAFALLPLMVAFGVLAAGPGSRKRQAVLFGAAITSVGLLQLPLVLRASTSHGLVPYLHELAGGLTFLDLSGLMSNVLVAFQLTGHVAFVVPPLSTEALLISLDPRPSSLVGWYALQPDLRVNVYTPYNGLGELANQGWGVTVAFFVVVGIYLGHLDSQVKRLMSQGHGLTGLLLFALACLFVLMTLQYNLRSGVRILYYVIALEIVVGLLRRIGERRALARQSRIESVLRRVDRREPVGTINAPKGSVRDEF
jgi:hypothetical protein